MESERKVKKRDWKVEYVAETNIQNYFLRSIVPRTLFFLSLLVFQSGGIYERKSGIFRNEGGSTQAIFGLNGFTMSCSIFQPQFTQISLLISHSLSLFLSSRWLPQDIFPLESPGIFPSKSSENWGNPKPSVPPAS